jgi:hypothetical protein
VRWGEWTEGGASGRKTHYRQCVANRVRPSADFHGATSGAAGLRTALVLSSRRRELKSSKVP